MKQYKKTIQEKQYLEDILTKIPSNTIIFKTVTGIGATTLELECNRNSIIIEPNVPVIKGKKAKGRLGVYEGVDVGHIMEYLTNKKIIYKKIIITPESFPKVLKAAENLNVNLYTDYFLLFDECDRTMKDVGYRQSVILPMEHFFLFKDKAFVSATAVIPTDPRFIKNKFKILTIEPDYNYQEEIDLIVTNNVLMSIKEIIAINDDQTICVFFNSINGIKNVINQLGIKNESNIYCSKKKATELSILGVKRVHENLTETFAKYNFFTSRFNAAVDIYMDIKPVLVMVTNLHVAHHTMIDPNSDAIQIRGRFRKGVERTIVISNIDSELNAKNEEQTKTYLDTSEECYSYIKAFRNATTKPTALEALNDAMELMPYSTFLNKDGTKNYYMLDNFSYEEKVKMLYQSSEDLTLAYKNNHFEPLIENKNYLYSDKENPSTTESSSILEISKAVIKALKKLEKEDDILYYIDNRDYVLNQLNLLFPEIVEAYHVLGDEELLKNAYSKNRISNAVKKKKMLLAKSNFDFIGTLQMVFQDGYKSSTYSIKDKFKSVIKEYGLTLNGTIEELKEYFHMSTRTTISSGVKGYVIKSSKFNNQTI